MAKKKGTGASIKVAKKAAKDANTHMDKLCEHINKLNTHLVNLNNNSWNGGVVGVKWYKNMIDRYTRLLQFVDGVNKNINDVEALFKKHQNTTNNTYGL